jgi:hypothetical protein
MFGRRFCKLKIADISPFLVFSSPSLFKALNISDQIMVKEIKFIFISVILRRNLKIQGKIQ